MIYMIFFVRLSGIRLILFCFIDLFGALAQEKIG